MQDKSQIAVVRLMAQRTPQRAFISNVSLKDGEDISELSDRLRLLLRNSSISVTGEIVVRKKNNSSGSGREACCALVPCDVKMVVKCLNNTQYDGLVLKVSKEVSKEKREQQREWNGSSGFGGDWKGPGTGTGGGGKKRRGKKKKKKPTGAGEDGGEVGAPVETCKSADTGETTEAPRATDAASAAAAPPVDSVDAFNARLNQPLSALMAAYGEYEPLPDGAAHAVHSNPQPPPPHSSQDSPTTAATTKSTTTTSTSSSPSSTPPTKSMLMPRSSAPIHITISSFGFLYGCPSSKSVTPSDPLPAYDCRHIGEVSRGVERLSGLSAVVRREVLRNADAGSSQTPTWELIHKIAKDATDAVMTSVVEDGAGWASPLSTTIFVGSQSGRHRSVVIAEAAAIAVRNLLRKNEDNRFKVVCSVGVEHRDVDRNKNFGKKGRNADEDD